ncbi:MAG: hypothetical protein J7L14_03690 [Candidatus Diapherotrites archaeon]|nr:hypothetical protein [Candidatus Diapherotrites archaeon]
MGLRRMVAIKTSHKEALDVAAELMASGHYTDVWVYKDEMNEVWVEDIEE